MTEPLRDPSARIWVAGHTGLVGSALVRVLERAGFRNLLLTPRRDLDLTRQGPVEAFFARERPDYVFLAAARVGGILANRDHPAEFIHENLAIQTNIIHGAWQAGVKRLLFLGSSCIYPKFAPQPLGEDALLGGPLEPTNEPYAVAKIAGVRMCQAYNRQYGTAFIPVMPANLYGPGDTFDPAASHVLPALLRKIHEAKAAGADTVELWGTGTPRRELLHVDDLAEACLFLMGNARALDHDLYNVGSGKEIAILDLARLIARIVGWRGGFVLDPGKPDGTPRKFLDGSRLRTLGWRPRIGLEEGIAATYDWFRENLEI